MRGRWLVFPLVVAAYGAASAASDAPPSCSHRGVEVVHERPADLALACEALADVLAYFRRIGFGFEPRFTVKFAEPRLKPPEGIVSYGHADVRSSIVVVYSSTHRRPWGLPWSTELAASFLRHELAHIAAWQILGREARELRREWHEFIAYAIQLDLMHWKLRAAVLANFPDVQAVADLSAVNEFTYGMDPDVFAVTAYLTYRERGAENLVRALLRGELVPPPFSFPFPVFPQEKR